MLDVKTSCGERETIKKMKNKTKRNNELRVRIRIVVRVIGSHFHFGVGHKEMLHLIFHSIFIYKKLRIIFTEVPLTEIQ